MTNRQNKKAKTYLLSRSDTCTGTSYYSFMEELQQNASLHQVIESIRAGDGIKLKVSKIDIHIRMYGSGGNNPFTVTPCFVQTAGVVTENDDVDALIVGEVLDVCIDDVFGFVQQQTRCSRRVRGSTTAIQQGVEFTLSVPPHLVNLLNKETETERLQDLHAVVIGHRNTANDVIDVQTITEVHYTEERKTLTIR